MGGETVRLLTAEQVASEFGLPSPRKPRRETIYARLARKSQREGECLLWTGAMSGNGYGSTSVNGRTVLVHRLAYLLAVGPIPKGLQIDHVCGNRRCIAPAHLEAITGRQNILLSSNPAAKNAAKTHCPKGHLYAGANLYVTPAGTRQCRACRRKSVKRRSP